MNTRQAKIIGTTVTDLLLYAEREGLRPTTSGIEVTKGIGRPGRESENVTLHACRANGDDFIVRVQVSAEGNLLPTGLYREWDAEAQYMTDWATFDALQIAR